MKKSVFRLQYFLEHIDSYRDKALFLFIKPHWPMAITPNQISFARVVIGIALIILLFFFGIEDKFLILSLFVIGALTDFIDGPVARGTNRVTEFGAMLDPTADRILIIPIAVYSLYPSHKWLLLTLFITEIVNAGFSLFYKSKEIYKESNIFGKAKMTLMSIVFIAILVVWPNLPASWLVFSLWLAVPLALLSILARIFEISHKKHETQH